MDTVDKAGIVLLSELHLRSVVLVKLPDEPLQLVI